MSAIRDGKMRRCQSYYKDRQDVSHKKNKRGFKTKAEAEQLKAQEQMLWIQRMNNIRARAEEIVRKEIIYTLYRLEWGKGICHICELCAISRRIQMTIWIFCSRIKLEIYARRLSND